MSPGIASAVALGAYALAFAPLLLLKWSPRGGAIVAILGVAAAGLVVTQTGLFQTDSLASTDVADLVTIDATADRCREMVQMMREGGVILEEPSDRQLTVNGELWQQLPQPIHDAVVTCVGPSEGTAEVDIIQR